MHVHRQLAQFADFPVHLFQLRIGYRWVGRRLFQTSNPVGRNHECLLLPQVESQQPVRRYLRGRIHPDLIFPQGQQTDHVIKLRGRRNIRIQFAAGINQHRRNPVTRSIQHCFQQGVLVLAIAVLVVEHVCRAVRLITAHAQRQTHITEVGGNVVVQRLDFVRVGSEALGQAFYLGANVWCRHAPITLQSRIPASYFFPAAEGGQLHRRSLRLPPLFLFLAFILVVVLTNQVRACPAINPPPLLLANFRIESWLGFEFDRPLAGNTDLELLIQGDAVLIEVILHPEMPWSQCRVDDGYNVVLKHLSRPQSWNRNMLLPVVGVDGSIPLNRCA